jgi:hypothetical protein
MDNDAYLKAKFLVAAKDLVALQNAIQKAGLQGYWRHELIRKLTKGR